MFEQPTRFGKYILKKRLAVGGMAEIFLAERADVYPYAKEIVIKRIHPEYSEDDEFVRMLSTEAQLATMLDHPNIVKAIEFDRVGEAYYIAMELVKGIDLKQVMTRARKHKQQLPVEVALQITLSILQALIHAHEFHVQGRSMRVVHRDISPHNILIGEQGEVKLTDFGIARLADQASRTASGVLKGKASYMAPEQTETSKVDARADLFALGTILWEMLTNQRLFLGRSEIDTLQRVRKAPITPPHEHNSSVPRELSRVILWALTRDLKRRIPSARDFYQHLHPFLTRPMDGRSIAEFFAHQQTQHAQHKNTPTHPEPNTNPFTPQRSYPSDEIGPRTQLEPSPFAHVPPPRAAFRPPPQAKDHTFSVMPAAPSSAEQTVPEFDLQTFLASQASQKPIKTPDGQIDTRTTEFDASRFVKDFLRTKQKHADKTDQNLLAAKDTRLEMQTFTQESTPDPAVFDSTEEALDNAVNLDISGTFSDTDEQTYPQGRPEQDDQRISEETVLVEPAKLLADYFATLNKDKDSK